MKERPQLTEEERQKMLGRSKWLMKWWVCCYVAAPALLCLPLLPGMSYFLVTAPPVFGKSVMGWAGDLSMVWVVCGGTCGLWSALLDFRAKPRRE